MSREPEIDQLFVRLCAVVDRVGGDVYAWELVEGIEDESRPRTQWFIGNESGVVMPLGYTRRQVLASLTAACSILAVILEA